MSIDISKAVSVDDSGKIVIDQTQIDTLFDGEVSRSVDSYRNKNYNKIKEEVRRELEEQAKLSAEEKFNKKVAEFEQNYKNKMLEINRREAKSKLLEDKSLFAEEEIEDYMPLIGDNEEANNLVVEKIIKNRRAFFDKTKASLTEELVKNQPNPQQSESKGEDGLAKQKAIQFSAPKQDAFVDLRGLKKE